jgi:histone deacetylase 11
LERLHPFDSRKYGRAWKLLRREVGRKLLRCRVNPGRPISRDELLRVHTSDYLDRLNDPKFVSGVLEVPPLRHLPGWLVDRLVLRPMRWATMGTIVGAREAIRHGLAINLSGGYHHASPDNGHGFSAYADVGLAVDELRRGGLLGEQDRIVYVDLDAHQGNGVCRTFMRDSRVFIYDQYNAMNFPFDQVAQRRIDCSVPLAPRYDDDRYLRALRTKLPPFLDAISKAEAIRFAIYNAGTDIVADDQLGGLSVSAKGVRERDEFVLDQLVSRHIPTLVLLSGGYSRNSFRLVAAMAKYVLDTWAPGAHLSVAE